MFRSISMLFDALQYLVENNCKKQYKAGHSTEMVWWLATWARKPEVSGSIPTASYVQRWLPG